MVDSIWGQGASFTPGSRPSAVGLQPAGAPAARPDSSAVAPARNAPADGALSAVSAGRATVRSMAREAPVDAPRVAELREAIANGRYRIDPDRIADAMLRLEQGLPTR